MKSTRIIVAIVAPAIAYADLTIAYAEPAVAESGETATRPSLGEVIPLPPPKPHGREPTAGDVEGKPQPGNESGRIDNEGQGDSAFRVIARGALFLPKLALEAALLPVRGAVWAEDRYQLQDLYYRVFYNDDRTIGLFPTATYETGFGANAGARFIDLDVFGLSEHLALQGTTGAATGETYREGLFASLGTGHRLGHHFELGLETNFDRRPSDPFYGIGNGDAAMLPAAPIDPRIDDTAVSVTHRYQEARIAMNGKLRVADRLQLLGTGALTDLRFAPGTTGVPIDRVYDTAGLVGFDHGVRHMYGEFEVRWDTRDRVTAWEPHDVHATGSFVAAFAGRIVRRDGGADFWRYGVELQHYWRIAKGPRLLITRFRGEAVTGTRDQVPFTELPMLGGSSFLRGYSFERFRDRAAGFGSVEYAWDVSHFVDAYVFADAGRVFPSVSDVTLHGLRVGYGVGLELHSDRGFLVEGSLATSIDGGVVASVSFNPVLDARPRWR